MQYWLLKSEPDEFSIDLLKARMTEEWTGVRNYQARNFMREMKLGDQFFFYHSSCAEPGIVGIGKIVRAAAADPTQFEPESDYFDAKSAVAEPRWSSVLVGYVRHTLRPISLDRLRAAAPTLEDFVLLNRGNRLSILPVSASQWRAVLKLEKPSA